MTARENELLFLAKKTAIELLSVSEKEQASHYVLTQIERLIDIIDLMMDEVDEDKKEDVYPICGW